MPGFIEIARDEAKKENLSVNYLHDDMRVIDFREEFDRVLLLFTSFGYFEDQGNFAVLQNISRALKPGGLFIFDTHNRDVFLKNLQPFIVTEKGEDIMIDRDSFDTNTGRWYNHRVVIRDGTRKDKPFFVRLYNPHEISNLIQQVGMEVYKVFGGFDSQPLTNDSQRMVIITRKPLEG
jgi:SAM-dependent methyltransferase